jgi:hypothetical protein
LVDVFNAPVGPVAVHVRVPFSPRSESEKKHELLSHDEFDVMEARRPSRHALGPFGLEVPVACDRSGSGRTFRATIVGNSAPP